MNFVEVIPSASFANKSFTYSIADDLKIKIGSVVLVNIGSKNVIGLISKLHNTRPDNINTLEIKEIQSILPIPEIHEETILFIKVGSSL